LKKKFRAPWQNPLCPFHAFLKRRFDGRQQGPAQWIEESKMTRFFGNKMITAALFGGMVALAGISGAHAGDQPSGDRNGSKFIGIDLDNGTVYYNGKNSGRYCVYKTVERYNRRTGYVELRRVRRCGRGLYL
jgi:hypothetical protein